MKQDTACTFNTKGKIWRYPGMAGWHFVSVPVPLAKKIKAGFSGFAHGFGSLKVTATIGNTKWETSIFPDKRTGTYLLPLKAAVRKKESIFANTTIHFIITIHLE